ncbi:MAG: polysaccharide deacetylase family protein [Syntrophales bacterium]|jgi:peptidoglycan/xylan/chitin deacetylase (PgdA/CDA1 family)|nr:polysaccharide deacetylase family protein [Syntrophales bacterium]MCK9392277.1 polysaccharide deacetylase family protein [Syntrophales bacterium]
MVKVVQSWDDGLVTDIRLIEIFRRHQAKAAFCLNPGLHHDSRSFGWKHDGSEVWRLSIHELCHVYEGCEICSHSMTHPCLTDIPYDQLIWEIKVSKQILEDIFHKPVLGFCYPFNACNESVKNMLRASGYKWARGNQHYEEAFPPADPFEFHPSCHFMDHDFWNKYDRLKLMNGVFFFWGHSYELISEGMWHNVEEKIKGISLDPDAEWFFLDELII